MSSVAKVIKREWLDWPFFEPRHQVVAGALDRFIQSGVIDRIDHSDVDGACRKLVRGMGEAGLLDCAVATPDGDATTIDSRSICLSRESLAYADGLADFAFAMQGLGSGAIALGGSAELRNAVLPKVRSGEWLSAFALSEKGAGSDVAAMSCTARGWPQPKGYANGMMAKGRLVVTGGVVGWDVEGRFAQGFAAQVRQTLENIVAILAEGGARADHLVRLTWYVVDMDEYISNLKALGKIYRDVIGVHYPSMALVQVVRLVEPSARLEIEATAVVPR